MLISILVLDMILDLIPVQCSYCQEVLDFLKIKWLKWLTYQYGKISRINSTVHAGNRTKNILILDKGSTHVLDDAIIIKETEYSVNFIKTRKKFVYAYITIEAKESITLKWMTL